MDMFCKKAIAQLPQGEVLSDMAALECLQEAGFSETDKLTTGCAQAVWEFKVSERAKFVRTLTCA